MWGAAKEVSSLIKVLLLCVSPFCSDLSFGCDESSHREVPEQTFLCWWASRKRKGKLKDPPWRLQETTEDGTLSPQITLRLHGLGANSESCPISATGKQLPAESWNFFRNINFMGLSSPPLSLLLASFSVENRQKIWALLSSSVISSFSIPSCASLRQWLSWYEKMLGSVLFRPQQIIPLKIFSDTSTAQQNMAPETQWKQTGMKALQDAGKPKPTHHQLLRLHGRGCCRCCNCCHTPLCSYDTSWLRVIDGGLSQ